MKTEDNNMNEDELLTDPVDEVWPNEEQFLTQAVRPGLLAPQPEEDYRSHQELGWRLICPPDNWEEPLPVNLAELRLLELLSLRLNLVLTRDDKRKKIYLGTAYGQSTEVNQPPEAPSGERDGSSGNPSQPQNPNSPSAGPNSPAGSLRFPSGWSVDVVPDDVAGSEYEAIDKSAAAPLVKSFPDAQISKNFRLSEFYPEGTQRPGEHSYDLVRIAPMLVNILEEIRKRAGDQTLHVTSGYRPIAYNRKVGGVSNSTHIDGLAADIYSEHISTEALWEICDDVIGDRGGVGFYPNQGFVHVDIRGYRARW